MRRAWLILLVACAACGDDLSGNAVDPTDVDADGIPNELDLCPTKRDPAQHDEDADGVGDVCDNCPGFANHNQADTTELAERQFPDGVGDACDRRPKVGDDSIAVFYPFADPAEAAAFSGTGWTIAGDRASTAGGAWQAKRGAQGDGLTLQVQISELAWTAQSGEIRLVLDGDGTSSGMLCSLVHDQTGETLVVHELGGDTLTSQLAPFQPTDRVVLTVARAFTHLAVGRLGCWISVKGAPEIRIDIPTVDDLAIGSYGIAVSGAMTSLDSAIVLTTPFACDTPVAGPGALLGCPTPTPQ